jgi:prostaglandin-endoperoxide synthase 2
MTMINVLFLREHNRIARLLAWHHPDWNEERLFQAARNTLTVVLLKVVLEDYVNHITPYHFQLSLDPRSLRNPRWYRTNRVAIEFNLLYRWHSLLPSRLTVGGRTRPLGECIGDIAPLPERGLGRCSSRRPCSRPGASACTTPTISCTRSNERASVRHARSDWSPTTPTGSAAASPR